MKSAWHDAVIVLYQVSVRGSTMQRELLRALEVERATVRVVVTTMVRKGLIERMGDKLDQRRLQCVARKQGQS